MFWADELAARFDGPQVVNDSKTPVGHRPRRQPARRRPPRRHPPRAAAGRPAQPLPVRRRRPRPHGRPGAADARRGRALHGRAAGARAGARRAATRPATRATSWASSSWARSRGLGIQPEIYWMSELYGDGTMDPYIRRALDGAETRPRHLPARQQRRAAAGLAAALGHLRDLRPHRHHAGHRLGRPDGRLRLPARPRHLGHRLRPQRARGALRRPRQAALQRRLGGQVEPLRHHHRGLRQGPRHQGRLPRPQRRHQPRGLRARAARSTCPTSSSTSAAAR